MGVPGGAFFLDQRPLGAIRLRTRSRKAEEGPAAGARGRPVVLTALPR